MKYEDDTNKVWTYIILLLDEDKKETFHIDDMYKINPGYLFVHNSSVWNHDTNKWDYVIETTSKEDALKIKFKSKDALGEALDILKTTKFNVSYKEDSKKDFFTPYQLGVTDDGKYEDWV